MKLSSGSTALLLACAVACCSLLSAAPATAHENSPRVFAVVDRVAPALPAGVRIKVENGPFTILGVENRTDTYLDVLGPDGEPVIRVGPSGALANLHSTQWFLSSGPAPSAQVPPAAQRSSTPRWGRLSATPRWGLFDRRVTTPVGPHRHAGSNPTHVTRLGEWSVPLRYGNRHVRVYGHLEYRPDLGSTVPRLTTPSNVAPGVQVEMLPGPTPAVFLSNTTSRTVRVRGRQGEPFARIGPEGVQVNVHSVTYAEDRRARGLEPGQEVDPLHEPTWVDVSGSSTFTWLDTRADTADQPAAAALEEGQPVTMGRWQIPLEVGDRHTRIEGATVWKPSARYAAYVRERGDGLQRMTLGVGSAMAAAVLLTLTLRASRRRGADGADRREHDEESALSAVR